MGRGMSPVSFSFNTMFRLLSPNSWLHCPMDAQLPAPTLARSRAGNHAERAYPSVLAVIFDFVSLSPELGVVDDADCHMY